MVSPALETLERAEKQLALLTKKDMAEVRAYAKPSKAVEKVMEAVMILRKSEPTWAEAKKHLRDPSFLTQLRAYDKEQLSDSILTQVREYTKDPEFDAEILGMISKAAMCLCMWVHAMEEYGRVFAPERAKLQQAITSLEQRQELLSLARQQLDGLIDKVHALREKHDQSYDKSNAHGGRTVEPARSRWLADTLASDSSTADKNSVQKLMDSVTSWQGGLQKWLDVDEDDMCAQIMTNLQRTTKSKLEEMMREVSMEAFQGYSLQKAASEVEAQLELKAVQIGVEKAEAEAALEEALPALDEAAQALNDLKKDDITELRSFAKPHQLVQDVCLCVIILKGGKDVSWKGAKAMMADTGFLRSLVEFEKDTLTEKQVDQVKWHINTWQAGNVTPDQVQSKMSGVSSAGTGLLKWVYGLINYFDVAKTHYPKRRAIAAAEKALRPELKKVSAIKREVDAISRTFLTEKDRVLGILQRVAASLATVEAAAEMAVLLTTEKPSNQTKGGGAAWVEYGGAELEQSLAINEELNDCPVRLLDARFLIALAAHGGMMQRRQALPEAAFISLEKLQQMGGGGKAADCLRIICLSHPWLQPDAPDPKGDNLKLLASVLREFVNSTSRLGGGTYAVFIDFMSLHQHQYGPDGQITAARSTAEKALFELALGGLAKWYSHPKTLVFKITELPEGYPMGFTFPPGAVPNQAAYSVRGWCYCESSMCALTKAYDYVLDLNQFSGTKTGLFNVCAECVTGRLPPVLPVDFAREIDGKSFTSRKADVATVCQLYEAAFNARMHAAKKLRYNGLGWDDVEMAICCSVLCSDALPALQELYLHNNKIGDDGLLAFVSALRSESLPKLEKLHLHSNQFGEHGLGALERAVSAGLLPSLTELCVYHQAAAPLRQACEVRGIRYDLPSSFPRALPQYYCE